MFTTTVGVLRIDRVELREELEQAWWYRCRIAHTVNRTSPPLASQQQPFERSSALVAALAAEFASRRRSELVQGASLATSEASLQGGQSKMLPGGRLRRGCAIAGTVRRGRSSARSEP